jgi:hypothetical protein
MTTTRKRNRPVQVTMTEDELDQLEALARMAGFRGKATYVKHLIEQDAAKRGVRLEFSGEWGGWRGETSEESGAAQAAPLLFRIEDHIVPNRVLFCLRISTRVLLDERGTSLTT